LTSRYRTLNFLHLSVTSTASIKHRAIAYNMKINTISAAKRITIIITYYMILMKFHARRGISRFRREKIHSRTLLRNFVGRSAEENHGSYLARARAFRGEIVSDGSNRQGEALYYGFAVIQPKSRRRPVPAIGSKSASGSNRSRD